MSKAKEPNNTSETQDQNEVPNGVFLAVIDGPEGISLDIQAVGSVKVTEIPTLLELGANFARKQLGL